MSIGTRLFVGEIPETSNDNDLRNAFSKYGVISNLDLKSKEGSEKKFAFITLQGSNFDIESCIKYFTSNNFNGSKIHVTRARESFLERLQRERQQSQKDNNDQMKLNNPEVPDKVATIRLGETLNPKKRRTDHRVEINGFSKHNEAYDNGYSKEPKTLPVQSPVKEVDQKKLNADKKRLESMKKKRQEFKEKQLIIKTGLIGIDQVPNKKIKFSDNEDDSISADATINNGLKRKHNSYKQNSKNLFEDDDDDDSEDLNFEVKEQFEGKKGQKVLELQSRYKSDKRFVLDQRFIEDDAENDNAVNNMEQIDVGQADEKTKQLNILQDVLGVTIKSNRQMKDNKNYKLKMGMPRFDPSQPDHAKFLAPVLSQPSLQNTKAKRKKHNEKVTNEETAETPPVELKVEASKEQFYKVSDTLKDGIFQANAFSLRSLFPQEANIEDTEEENTNYIPLEKKKEGKVKNPLDLGDKNPFKYDSSESEDEDDTKEDLANEKQESKIVWNENLFFSKDDNRFQEGLAFFNTRNETEVKKDRRELKFLMKKRLHNRERKDQMFQKKIGGRKKAMKKTYRKKR